MIEVQVLRVFADRAGLYGNALGVVLDPAGLTTEQQQTVATELGFSETAFVHDMATARLRLFTPVCELAFAGHPLVGTSWLLARETGVSPKLLRPERLDEPVTTFTDDDVTWVRGSVADAPPWRHVCLDSADEVHRVTPETAGTRRDMTQLWSWIDERAGLVRARVFAAAYGVAEDEACGSATLLLASMLGRELTVLHGHGSMIFARPAGPGRAEVGGHVVHDRVERVRKPAG